MEVQGALDEIATLLAALEARMTAVEASVAALDGRVVTVEDLTQFQSVQTADINGLVGPHLVFERANLHVRSASGATDDGGTPLGLGNLVVGYNEEPTALLAGERAGSHNLIVGPQHRYLHTGGLVAGANNTISGVSTSVSGGRGNTASGGVASVSGGDTNSALGGGSSVSGGFMNTADGGVAGGEGNTATGTYSSVGGGLARSVLGDHDWSAGTLFEDF